MNVVYLSPHFPPNYRNFCHRLHELGATVLGVADASYDELGAELQESLTEYYRVDDMESYDHLLRAVAYLVYRHGRVDRIESHNEYWLEPEAALRTDFNVEGPKRDGIARVKRKSRMKEVFRQAGVAVARGGLVRDRAEAEGLAAALGYPLIIKPDVGVGAAGACRLRGDAELAAYYEAEPAGECTLEEFIEGTLLSFDGLADGEGKVAFCTGHVFKQGIMETVRDDDDMYYYSLRELPPDLEAAGRAAVAAFDIRRRFFHIEFFRRRSDGRVVALEMNMRPPGGLTTEMFNYANDIDVYREWANVVTGRRFEAEWSRPFHCVYMGRKERLTYRRTHDEVLTEAGGRLVHHERIQSVFAPAIGDYAYLARDAELEPLLALARFALEKA